MTQSAKRDDDLRDDDPYAMWDAAYVLGSLSGNDRREFEAHLATCPRCREAVAELSGIPALLAQIDAEEVEAIDNPPADEPPLRPEVLDSLLQKVEWRRRRTRRLSAITLAAAAALLAVALVVGIWPGIRGQGGESEPMASAVTMSKVAQTPINAIVTLTGFGWGHGSTWSALTTMRAAAMRRHKNLSMVVVGHNGTQSDVATWVGVNGATALPS